MPVPQAHEKLDAEGRLDTARAALTPEQARDLALDLARETLVRVLTVGITAHRLQVSSAIENIWDKYHVALPCVEQRRTDSNSRLSGMLKDLGYA